MVLTQVDHQKKYKKIQADPLNIIFIERSIGLIHQVSLIKIVITRFSESYNFVYHYFIDVSYDVIYVYI